MKILGCKDKLSMFQETYCIIRSTVNSFCAFTKCRSCVISQCRDQAESCPKLLHIVQSSSFQASDSIYWMTPFYKTAACSSLSANAEANNSASCQCK
jgi:hypothetical protein